MTSSKTAPLARCNPNGPTATPREAPGRLAVPLTACLILASLAEGSPTPEIPNSRGEVAAALGEIAEKYGRDAVRLQSHLLQNALMAGSVLAASAGVGGIEEVRDKRFLVLNLETGIVYDDAEGKTEQYPAAIWRDVVEPTLREFTTLDVPADGLALRITYHLARYQSRDQIVRLADEGRLSSDVLTLHVPTSDVLGLASAELTPSEVLRRAGATLNGQPVQVDLGPAGNTPVAPRPTPVRPLLPE